MSNPETCRKMGNVFHALEQEGLIEKCGVRDGEALYRITMNGAIMIAKIAREEFYSGLNGGDDGHEYAIAPGEDPADVEFEYAKIVVEGSGGPLSYLAAYYMEKQDA